jgi:hypothetical protein
MQDPADRNIGVEFNTGNILKNELRKGLHDKCNPFLSVLRV